YNYNRSALLDSNKRIMTMIAENGAEEINDFLGKHSNVFKGWTNDDIYGMAIEYNTLKEIEDNFETMLNQEQGFSLVVLTDTNGKVLSGKYGPHVDAANQAGFEGRTIPYASSFTNEPPGKVCMRSNIFLSANNYPETYIFSSPTKNSSNEVNGLLIAFLDWSSIQERVLKLNKKMTDNGLRETEAVVWSNESQKTLSHSNSDVIGGDIFGDNSFAGFFGGNNDLTVENFEIDGRSKFLAYARLSDLNSLTNKDTGSKSNICLTVYVDSDEMFAQLQEVLTVSIAFAVIGIIIGLLVAFILDKSIAKPIHHIIEDLSKGGEQVSMASQQISSASQSLSEGASDQAASLEEVSSGLEEMTSVTKQTADNAHQAKILADEAGNVTENGIKSMEVLADVMKGIKQSSDDTAKIIKVIDEIAFQTNLLALNAAVEAARAGEAGKGFAVVAEEVRNLAQRSAEAAKNTNSLIEGAQKNANNGVTATEEFTTVLNEITANIRKVTGLISEVSDASNEQANGIGQINTAINRIDATTQQNASSAEESAAASEEMTAQANQLQQIVGQLSRIVMGKTKRRTDESYSVSNEHSKSFVNNGIEQRHTKKMRLSYNTAFETPKTSSNAGKKSSLSNITKGKTKSEDIIPLEEDEYRDL
ncbi:MAG: methyl-accepting chemotaxis protein, partial [candidate division Zixibacteria bacterium]|nr:methyl-accepting chemotaxis protein [candidate division Zixibacteria bacterium]